MQYQQSNIYPLYSLRMRWQGLVKQNKRLPTEAHSYLTEISILLFAISLSFTPGLSMRF